MTGDESCVRKLKNCEARRSRRVWLFVAAARYELFAFYLLACALYYQFIPCEPDEHFPL
jgi:hypothetical protein